MGVACEPNESTRQFMLAALDRLILPLHLKRLRKGRAVAPRLLDEIQAHRLLRQRHMDTSLHLAQLLVPICDEHPEAVQMPVHAVLCPTVLARVAARARPWERAAAPDH